MTEISHDEINAVAGGIDPASAVAIGAAAGVAVAIAGAMYGYYG
jgi:preprotein translocase subunit Sec61beta